MPPTPPTEIYLMATQIATGRVVEMRVPSMERCKQMKLHPGYEKPVCIRVYDQQKEKAQ